MVEFEPSTPETRAAVLAEALRQVSALPVPATYAAAFFGVMDAFGKPEEEIGPDIHSAIFLLVRHGLIESNTYETQSQTFSRGADTMLKSCRALTTYVFHATSGVDEGDGGEEEADGAA